jgi:hypothetical protein
LGAQAARKCVREKIAANDSLEEMPNVADACPALRESQALKAQVILGREILLSGMVLPDRIELSTSPLPMECSTTELRQRTPLRIGQKGLCKARRSLPQGPLPRKRGASAPLLKFANPSRRTLIRTSEAKGH